MLTLPQLPTERPITERLARALVRGLGLALALAGVLTLTNGVARAVARALGGAMAVLALLTFGVRAAQAVTVSPTAVYIPSKNPSAPTVSSLIPKRTDRLSRCRRPSKMLTCAR